MGTILLAAISLTGCGGEDGGRGNDKNGAPAPSHQDKPLAELDVPAAYDAGKGWDETLTWLPEAVETLPVTAAPRTGGIALLHAAPDGYTVKVRAADTGRVRWTSAPWDPPTPLEDAAGDPARGDATEIPDVIAVEQDGREYIVAYGHGLRGKDELHEGTEVVGLAVYAADATGTAVKPLRQIEVPVTANPGEVHLSTAGGRLLVGWDEDGPYPLLSAAVDLATGKTVTYDDTDALLPQCAEAEMCSRSRVMAATAQGPLVGMGDGGFGMPGRWFSDTVRPDGVPARLGIYKQWNGTVYGANDGLLLAHWEAVDERGSDTDPVWSVHDVRTGALKATSTCGYDPKDDRGWHDSGAEREHSVVTSLDGRYLAAGPVAFDLRKEKGICLAGDGDRKSVALVSIHDDGTAYGSVEKNTSTEGTPPVIAQVDLTAGLDSAKVLGTGTDVPFATGLRGAGLFLHRGDDLSLRVSLRRER
ncbi:hypothetical protein [Streptomyces albus]|uniref:hypothetical protein n=1 Tax=Streptomyces albus TaxID=1888 RepID=UPI000AAA0447|nr:hypothetical protein [Streptomyces albus]